MWEPALEHDATFVPAWQWIYNSTWSLSYAVSPAVGSMERLVRIKSRANPSYLVSAHPHKGVVLMPLIGEDAHQLWLVDDSCGKSNGFVLINKATGQALRHVDPQQQVCLCDYSPMENDEQVLWTLGPGAGEGFHALKASHAPLYLDISREDVAEGTPILAFDWRGGLHQMWGLQPVGVLYTLRSRLSSECALRANPEEEPDSPLRLRALDESDARQLWTVEAHFDQSMTLRNSGTGLVLRAASMEMESCRLSGPDQAEHFTMWLLGKDEGNSYFSLRPVHQRHLVLDAVGGKVTEGCGVILYPSLKEPYSFGWWEVSCLRQNQVWGFFPVGAKAPVKPL